MIDRINPIFIYHFIHDASTSFSRVRICPAKVPMLFFGNSSLVGKTT